MHNFIETLIRRRPYELDFGHFKVVASPTIRPYTGYVGVIRDTNPVFTLQKCDYYNHTWSAVLTLDKDLVTNDVAVVQHILTAMNFPGHAVYHEGRIYIDVREKGYCYHIRCDYDDTAAYRSGYAYGPHLLQTPPETTPAPTLVGYEHLSNTDKKALINAVGHHQFPHS